MFIIFKKYISKFSYKKIAILLGVLLLTIGLGNGMNMAFAGQDAGSSILNWFAAKKTVSEQEIAEAIDAEKNQLMEELKIALQEEKQRVEEELAAFTEDEKQKRTIALQEYAEYLKANMTTDLTEEKEAIIAELDAEYNQAIEELNNSATPIEATPQPELGTEEELDSGMEPDTEEELSSEIDSDSQPDLTTETDMATPENNPEVDPTEVLNPENTTE